MSDYIVFERAEFNDDRYLRDAQKREVTGVRVVLDEPTSARDDYVDVSLKSGDVAALAWALDEIDRLRARARARGYLA